MPVTAHIINVAERTDRWERFNNDWKDKTTIKIEREDAFKPDGVTIRDVYDAVFLKHRQILTKAKEQGEKFCLIMEDDAKPCKDFEERFEAIMEYLSVYEDKWEVFNGGMLSIRDCVTGIVRLTHKTDLTPPTMLLNVNRGAMAHFLVFNVEKALKKMEDWEAEDRPQFDGWYSHKLDCIASIPYLAEQHDGFSDAGGQVREWSDHFKFEEAMMLYSLREFISYSSSSPSLKSASDSLPLEA
jgi:GR25 family glycosyltransferase involved in LPS biosynthesis